MVTSDFFLSLAGGSLDVYKKIPEHVLGRIAVAVSPSTVTRDEHYMVLKKLILI